MTEESDTRPPRPHLPPLLIAGLALWGATALLWPPLRAAAPEVLVGMAAGACAIGAVAGVWLFRAGREGGVPLAPLVSIAVLAACALCGFWGAVLQGSMALASSGGAEAAMPWRAVLAEDARQGEFGWHAAAQVRTEDGRTFSARLNLPEDAALLQGEEVRGEGALKAPSEATAEYYWNAGLAGSLTVGEDGLPEAVGPSGNVSPASNAPLFGLRRHALGLIAEHAADAAPLLQALVCGWRPAIEEAGLYEQFKAVGLAHLVAVSGAHLSIVTLFVAAGLKLLRLGRRATASASALFLVGYVVFTGMPISALRAAVMASTGLLSLCTDRRSSALSALGLCLVVFVGLDPPCALSASFALSAGSTLGIVLFAPLISSAFDACGRLGRAVGDPLALTGASAVATQPYAAALFSQLPLLSPLANLVAGPLFTLACVAGFAAVLIACILPAAAPWLIGAAALAATPLSLAVGALASVPGTCVPVDALPVAAAGLSCALCAVLWAWWPRVSLKGVGAAAASMALLLLLFRLPLGLPTDAIVMLDVGQGDAFLVRSGKSALLIDTGNQDGMLREALARQRVTALDAVAITHSDDDHCGSLPVLGDVAPASALLMPEGLAECPCEACAKLMGEAALEGLGARTVGLAPGDEVRCGRFRLTVLWPEGLTDEGGNADSLCLLAGWDGDGDGAAEWTALFTGDAEADQLHQIVDELPDDGVDVLKVGHHGSKHGLDAELAERLSPQVALIGVGENNRYGHPSREALDVLEAVGCSVFRSDESGDVSVAFSEDKLTVSSQRP